MKLEKKLLKYLFRCYYHDSFKSVFAIIQQIILNLQTMSAKQTDIAILNQVAAAARTPVALRNRRPLGV